MRKGGQRFPSDRRAWFRVIDDLLDDPRFDAADWVLSSYIRILAVLNRSRSRDGSVRLSQAGLAKVLGKKKRDAQRKRLGYLVEIGLISAAYCADFTLILVPKWPRIQGFRKQKHRDEEEEEEVDVGSKKKRARPRARAPDPDDPTEGYDAEKLARMLGAADAPAKLAWLRERLPQIVPAARAKLAGQGVASPTRRQLTAAVRERLMAFWAQRQKSTRKGNGTPSPAQAREARTKAAAQAVIDGG
jgi:hypothetical protein